MERRRYPRIPVQMNAAIEIDIESQADSEKNYAHTKIHGVVNTIDISLGGFCVKILNSQAGTDKRFNPAMAYNLAGKFILAYFKDHGLTISGKVVRVDPKTLLMAVVITRVSDIDCWRNLCGQAIYNETLGK
jgi:hypothetical protein